MAPAYQFPNGLLIILHLHLLNYPLQDAAGYDERLFDHSRGMRDRNKAMEDITYFLVGKIEGGKERAKIILPTYPCLQPADTTAYRIALSKYVEALRNTITHTTNASDPKGKRSLPASSAEGEASAWWWKDVVVRKSILDECCGDRFERLILALSSHAVLKNTARPSSALQSQASSAQDREGNLRALSQTYTMSLSAAQNARLEWERSAAALLQRQLDLAVVRARIADPKLAVSSTSKYDSLTTDRLLALRDSRYQDLLRGPWQGEEGLLALRLINQLAGLLDVSPSTIADSVNFATDTGAHSHPIQLTSKSQADSETPPPLPIAAAHHPAHLHSLGLPLFPRSSQPSLNVPGSVGVPEPPSPHAISERLAAIEKVQVSLQNALTGAQNIHAQIQQRLQSAKARKAERPSTRRANVGLIRMDASLWERRAGKPADFKMTPDAAILAKFDLAPALSETAIEKRIAHIRTALLPPFTADPRPLSDSDSDEMVPAPARISQQASRLRQPSSRTRLPSSYITTAQKHDRGLNAVQAGQRLAAPPPAAGQPKSTVPSQRVRITAGPKPGRIPSASGRGVRIQQEGESSKAAAARRLSRRASAARARRSTMFGRGEDAEILRIVESVQDRSDSEGDSDPAEPDSANRMQTPQPRTPAGLLGTRGTLLSTVKKSAPRQSFDIEKYERVHMPRLPSLHLQTALELDENEELVRNAGIAGGDAGEEGADGNEEVDGNEEGDGVLYEGNSMTLADILLQAGHQENTSMQLLGEGELEDDLSDWE